MRELSNLSSLVRGQTYPRRGTSGWHASEQERRQLDVTARGERSLGFTREIATAGSFEPHPRSDVNV